METYTKGGQRRLVSSADGAVKGGNSPQHPRKRIHRRVRGVLEYVRETESVPAVYQAQPSKITDFIYVPITVERMIIFGVMGCADSLLFVFTVLPIRALITIFYWLKGWPLAPIQRIDVVKMILLFVGFYGVHAIHIPNLLAFISLESLFKLKVLLKIILPMLDLLLGSFGVNLLAGLWWVLGEPSHWFKWRRGFLWHFTFSAIYIVGHSTLLLFYLAVYDYLIGLERRDMIPLLLLIQFAEMKSAVNKEIKDDKLHNMCQKDILERFTLIVFLVLLFCFNVNVKHADDVWDMEWLLPLTTDILIIYLSELIVDWTKHTSIVNYMGIGPHVYTKLVLGFNKRIDHSGSRFLDNRCKLLAQDLGLMPVTFAVVVMKVVTDFIRVEAHTWFDLIVGFLIVYGCLLLLRVVNGYILYSYENRFDMFEPYFDRATTQGKLYLSLDAGRRLKKAKQQQENDENQPENDGNNENNHEKNSEANGNDENNNNDNNDNDRVEENEYENDSESHHYNVDNNEDSNNDNEAEDEESSLKKIRPRRRRRRNRNAKPEGGDGEREKENENEREANDREEEEPTGNGTAKLRRGNSLPDTEREKEFLFREGSQIPVRTQSRRRSNRKRREK